MAGQPLARHFDFRHSDSAMLKSTRRDVSRCVVTLILDLGPTSSPSTLVGDELCLATADQVIDDGRCVSPVLALFGRGQMPDLSPLFTYERT